MKTLFLFLCLASHAWGDSFRVATFNVNWGNQRGDLVLKAINTAKPDLICVQSERFLRDKLSAEFPHFVSMGIKVSTRASGSHLRQRLLWGTLDLPRRRKDSSVAML